MVASTGFASASARYIRTRMVSNIHRPFFRNVVQISLRNDLSFGGYRLVNRIRKRRTVGKNVFSWVHSIPASANMRSDGKWNSLDVFRLEKQYLSIMHCYVKQTCSLSKGKDHKYSGQHQTQGVAHIFVLVILRLPAAPSGGLPERQPPGGCVHSACGRSSWCGH